MKDHRVYVLYLLIYWLWYLWANKPEASDGFFFDSWLHAER